MNAQQDWNRLDNAAKIFPPNSNKRDPKVFRFACELYEKIEPELLQKALDIAIEDFPIYRSTLRRGLFWYYLKSSDVRPLVKQENEPPCSPIYDANSRNLLFEVSYFQKRINLEVYHALTDGTGALQFLKNLVYHYVLLAHKDDFSLAGSRLEEDASLAQKGEDSFAKYYTHEKSSKKKRVSGYKIRGMKVPEGRIQVIEGVMPIHSVLEQAHHYGTTLTGFLTAVFLFSIYQNMPQKHRNKPIVLSIPVNLRKYFYSESVRNFFCTIDMPYTFSGTDVTLQQVAEEANRFLKQQLTPQKLSARMNGFTAIEHNTFARVTPLVLKDFVLRVGGKISEKRCSGAISNIGKINMPAGFEKYIRLFDVFVSTNRIQICLCSFGENLTVSFSSAFVSTEIQKKFFRLLADMGIEINIAANQV